MPYLPSHMGAGLLAKAINPAKFSLTMFGLTQVIIDIQPLINRINPTLLERHTPSHTIIGATMVMLLCLLLREPISKLCKVQITPAAAFYGAAFGVYSHLLLDGINHVDVSNNLFWPFNIDSHLYYLISNSRLVSICLAMGSIGIVWLYLRGEISTYLKYLKK